MDTKKIITARQLKLIVNEAIKYNFNRAVSYDAIKNLDKEGFNVISIVLPFHNGDFADIPHHRCQVFAKIYGSEEPREFYLDVAVDTFNTFRDASYVTNKIAEMTQKVVKEAL